MTTNEQPINPHSARFNPTWQACKKTDAAVLAQRIPAENWQALVNTIGNALLKQQPKPE